MLTDCLKESIQRLGLEVVESQVQKMVQLFNTLRGHHGVIVVGGAGGGKSTLHRVLAYMLSRAEYSRRKFVVCLNSLTFSLT